VTKNPTVHRVYQPDTIDWQIIEFVNQWLDGNVAARYQTQPLAQDWARISKVQEELGEAVQAFIGFTGQNPHRGVTNDLDDVLEELADTAITAIFAIQHFTGNSSQTKSLIRSKLEKVYQRALKEGEFPDERGSGR